MTGQELRDQIAEALRTARWDGRLPDDAHGQHQYHGACAICRGDVTAIADAALPIVQVRLDEQAAEIERLRAIRTLRLMWAKVGEHGMPDTREIFAQCARDLGSILDKEQP